MDEDNMFLVSFRTMFIVLMICSSIFIYSPILLLFNIPAYEINEVNDFECDDLLETDLYAHLYYQECLLDKEGTAKTIYDHLILLLGVIQVALVAIPCAFFGFSLIFIHRIKLLNKTNWITATTRFKFGKVDPDHARKIMGK